MNEKINIDIDDNNLCTKTSTSINTPNIGISVATESTEKTEKEKSEASPATKESTDKSKPEIFILRKQYYWAYIGNKIFSFSTLLFLSSMGSCTLILLNSGMDLFGKIFFGLFAIISLFLSVIIKLKTDDTKWIKLSLIKALINNLNNKEIINSDMMNKLLKILEL